MEYARNCEEQLFFRTNVVGYAKKFKDNIIKAFRINRLFAECKSQHQNVIFRQTQNAWFG